MGKTVYLIVDGMGDLPIKNLAKKTPLAYAFKPNLSSMSKNAVFAYPTVLGKLAPQSDAGVMADLGYDPTKYSTGRGWFECLGLGMEPRDGDVSIRVNFGEVNRGLLSSVRVYMSDDELKELESDINEKVRLPVDFDFRAGEDYRAGLVLRKGDKEFSQFVSNNEPGYIPKFYPGGRKLSFASRTLDRRIKPIKAVRSAAGFTADIMNSFVKQAAKIITASSVYKRRKKSGLQAPNYVFLRDGAVSDPRLPDITNLYKRSWCAVTDMPLEKGIATAAGMKVLGVKKLKDVKVDFEEKAEALSAALRKFDAVYLHIKQTDAASHLGRYAEKYAIIESLDKIIISVVRKELNVDRGDVFVLTCDHCTSCDLRRHINSNIPVFISGRGLGPSRDFNEESSKNNHIKNIRKATDIMPFVMKL